VSCDLSSPWGISAWWSWPCATRERRTTTDRRVATSTRTPPRSACCRPRLGIAQSRSRPGGPGRSMRPIERLGQRSSVVARRAAWRSRWSRRSWQSRADVRNHLIDIAASAAVSLAEQRPPDHIPRSVPPSRQGLGSGAPSYAASGHTVPASSGAGRIATSVPTRPRSWARVCRPTRVAGVCSGR